MQKNKGTMCKDVKKALIDRGMSVKELAANIGLTREYVSSVINGSVQSKTAEETIRNYLGLSA